MSPGSEKGRIAFSDIRKAVTWGPGEDGRQVVTIKPGYVLDDETARAIDEVSQTRDGKISRQAQAPLLNLGKHLGIFKEALHGRTVAALLNSSGG